MTLLSADPGKWAAGVAAYGDDNQLLAAKLLKSRSRNPAQASFEIGLGAAQFAVEVFGHRGVDRVCCEMPNIRARIRQKGDPNDLLFLTLVNGAIWTAVPTNSREPVPVNDWKSNIPKEIIRGRLTGDWGDDPPLAPQPPKLSLPEIRLLGEDPNHNVVDAVGIGLWALHRL